MPYDISDSVPIAWNVFDDDGNPVTAATAVVTVTKPDGTPDTPSIPAPASDGQYRVTYVPDVAGRYTWQSVTTSPNTAYQDVFDVREAESPSLVSLADAKAHLNLTTATHDDELREYLEAATEIVESYVGPIVKRTHTARVSGGRCGIALPHTQVVEVTAVTLVSDGSSPLTLSDLSVDSPSGVVTFKNGGSFPSGPMDFAYTVGRTFVKANWTLAAKIIVKHNWETQLGSLPSIQGDSPGYVVSGAGYLVPFRAVSLLTPDQVPAGFA